MVLVWAAKAAIETEPTYYETNPCLQKKPLNPNLRSPQRELIELKIEHADLDALVDMAVHALPVDELLLRRLKKRRLHLRDQISKLEVSMDPPEPA